MAFQKSSEIGAEVVNLRLLKQRCSHLSVRMTQILGAWPIVEPILCIGEFVGELLSRVVRHV